jgi:uncharacterized protein YciI
MQFLVFGYDGEDAGALDRRLAVREAHIALGDKLRDEGKLLYGVAMLNDKGQMCGSVLVGEFVDRSELDKWLEIEPYVTGKVWQRVEVIPCKVGPSFLNK